jgi:hypothetical protein
MMNGLDTYNKLMQIINEKSGKTSGNIATVVSRGKSNEKYGHN